ncbi:hypothetical protein O181_082706 [Austropuccinia psidii MF-1]|uniref:Uncharacterized protein n=1 Tax=Austropuccinia psidii MF-1 TaxID=1389203 RepID=A0A9Q3FT51_9BASI|nr:hypothetical protein [Austropuccinia psidii MF-1]
MNKSFSHKNSFHSIESFQIKLGRCFNSITRNTSHFATPFSVFTTSIAQTELALLPVVIAPSDSFNTTLRLRVPVSKSQRHYSIGESCKTQLGSINYSFQLKFLVKTKTKGLETIELTSLELKLASVTMRELNHALEHLKELRMKPNCGISVTLPNHLHHVDWELTHDDKAIQEDNIINNTTPVDQLTMPNADDLAELIAEVCKLQYCHEAGSTKDGVTIGCTKHPHVAAMLVPARFNKHFLPERILSTSYIQTQSGWLRRSDNR